MKKIYTAPHMTVEQVKVNCRILEMSNVDTQLNSLNSESANKAETKGRDGGVWSTDKNNLDWDF